MLKDGGLEELGLAPWIGERYGVGSRFGVPVLVLGKSSYGRGRAARPMGTKEAVRWFTQRDRTQEGSRHWYFTMVANVLRMQTGSIDDADLARVFQEIAFYNFVPPIAGDLPRSQPTAHQWARAEAPFRTVLGSLRPDAVLVVGRGLSQHLPEWPDSVNHAVVPGRASSRLSYDDAVPTFRSLIEQAKERVGGVGEDLLVVPVHASADAQGVTTGREVRDEALLRVLPMEGLYLRPRSAKRFSTSQLASVDELYSWASEAAPWELEETLATCLRNIDGAMGQAGNMTLELPPRRTPDGLRTLIRQYHGAIAAVFRAAANNPARAPQVDDHLAAIDELVTNSIGLWHSEEAAARYLERPSSRLNGSAPLDLASRSPDGASQAAAAVKAMRSRLEKLDARAQEIADRRPTPTPDTILQAAVSLFGDDASAQAFLERPHALLGGRKPLDVAKESMEGLARVARLLRQAQATTAI